MSETNTQTTQTQTTNTTAPQANVADWQAQIAAWKSKAEEAEAKLTKREETELEQKKQYKELYEREKKRAEELETRNKRINETFVQEKKYSAIKAAAMAAGIIPEALDDLEHVDTSHVIVETTNTGKVNVLGAEAFAADLKKRRPFWFGDKNPPNVNPETPTTRVMAGAKPTLAELRAAEKKAKSGDPEDYKVYEQMNARYLAG